MNRTWTVAALAALIVWPAVASGQETRRPRGMLSFSGNRGRIGVLVKTDADPQNDKIGARIEAVTPGGPAEKAGLKAGDLVTRFQGTALGGAAAEGDDESGPGMKLIELARSLDPGDTVQVEYRRGTENRKATLVADEVQWSGATTFEFPDMPRMGMLPRIQVGPGELEWSFGHPWGGIELVSLNPDLGEYFGTREGVLVVRAPEDSSLALKGGDVILAIGGRKPASPSHAMRILRSYDAGETVTIDVQRKQRRTTLTWKVPERTQERYRIAPTPRRPREEPSRYRITPKIRTAPLKLLRAARVYRAI
ncbi:MAG TPA: PDZ domain-containing protein [Gemmatimonadales bacterium]